MKSASVNISTMAFTCKVFLVALIFNLTCLSTHVHAVGNCPPLWTKFQNHCYRFYGGPKSWIDAELHCRNMATCNGASSAHLVSIHNQDENSFVFDYWQSSLVKGCTTPRLVDSVWIGLSDIDTEGTMVWSDGTSKDFTKWIPGQPDDAGGNEDCVHMHDPGTYLFGDKWNDLPCTALVPFICKMPSI